MFHSTTHPVQNHSGGMTSSGRSEVWKHSIWAVVGKAVTSVASLLMTSGIARLLSPEDFGSFSLFRSVNMVIGLACTFGLGTAGMRALSHAEGRSSAKTRFQIIRETLLLNVGISAVFGFLAFAFCFLFSDRTLHLKMSFLLALAATISGIGFGFTQTVSDLLRGCGDLKGSNLIGGQRGIPIAMLTVVVLSFFGAVFGYTSWELAAYFYALGIITASVVAGFLLVRAARTPGNSVPSPPRQTSDVAASPESIFSTAWPLAIVSLLIFLTSQGDQFLTGLFSDLSDVAPYLASRRVIMVLVLPLGVMNMAVRGLIGPLFNRGELGNLQRILQGGTILASFPSIVVGVLCLFVPHVVLRVILGAGYEGAALFLQILIPGEIIMVITGSCGLLLSLTGFHRIVMWVTVIMATLLMTGGPLAATYYGGEGLAALTSTLIGLQNLILWYAAWKLTGINTFCRPGIRHLREAVSVFRRRKSLIKSASTFQSTPDSVVNPIDANPDSTP